MLEINDMYEYDKMTDLMGIDYLFIKLQDQP